MNSMDVVRFKQLPILGIMRGIGPEDLEPLLATVESSGLKTIEITMNTEGAARLIRKAVALSGKRLTIGAGTVLDMKSLKSALDAGASFIVMPVLVRDVMAYCVKHRIPAFPGALTPSEIHAAWLAGAAMVKVFPSGLWGPEYFREIKGPLNDVELLACGGVTPRNLGSYFAHGAGAVSFGGSVFKKEWLLQKDFQKIARSIREYIREFRSIKTTSPVSLKPR
ncbi:MAG: bifunctional 4-hydroxy-2-oxoglutarate aldolase/2-dehydro-3-deoxy-phosphogluconate aldolase [Candidatus Omnitrophica bacterium]|nr:bifunctional 4-hydroxy-2-oxoglutarate aldolase/2-dehydro-3-deoxy-phosphogluconate aldolase [Candidatus Omnitrophota bacterium]